MTTGMEKNKTFISYVRLMVGKYLGHQHPQAYRNGANSSTRCLFVVHWVRDTLPWQRVSFGNNYTCRPNFTTFLPTGALLTGGGCLYVSSKLICNRELRYGVNFLCSDLLPAIACTTDLR